MDVSIPPPPPASVSSPQNHHHHQEMMNNNFSSNQLHEQDQPHKTTTTTKFTNNKTNNNKQYMILLAATYLCLFVGSVSSSLLSRFFFIHKGSSRWVSTWVQSAGFPLLLLPIYLPHHLLKCTPRKPFSHFTPKLFVISVLVGFLIGLNNLLFSWGTSYLPVSTSSLLLSTQLAFTLILSVVIAKEKVTFTNLNCAMLLTLSSVLIALGSAHDRPQGLTTKKYFIGFFCTISAGVLFALYLPVMDRIYKKVYCYSMMMEMQLIMEVAATVLATAGMAADGGFSEMRVESEKVFDLGPNGYWVTVGSSMVTWQLCFVGTAGMVFLTTSFTGGVCMTALMAMNVVGGVIAYGEEFGGVKVVATLMSLWGFCSYVYGIYVKMKEEVGKDKINGQDRSVEMGQSVMDVV